MQQEGMNVYYLDDDSEMRKVLISEVPIDGWVLKKIAQPLFTFNFGDLNITCSNNVGNILHD